jgi:LysR substrate binding domain
VLAVAADHPLADRRTIALTELRDETFALDVPGDNPDYDNAVVEACRRSGFEPRTHVSTIFHDAWEGAVHNEGCVGLTVHTSLHAAHRDLRLLTLREPLTFPIDLIWHNPTGTPPQPSTPSSPPPATSANNRAPPIASASPPGRTHGRCAAQSPTPADVAARRRFGADGLDSIAASEVLAPHEQQLRRTGLL